MAKILAILCSGRKKGYTATLLAEAINGAKEFSEQVEVELVHLHDYRFGPCTSCFHCMEKVKFTKR
jgi:multimeric flavodoxin WrbA